MNKVILTFILTIAGLSSLAQMSSVSGKVFNEKNNEPLPFAVVMIQGSQQGATSDIDGNYSIKEVNPGLYNIECSIVGFEKRVVFEIEVTLDRPATVDFSMLELANETGTVEVVSSTISNREESPVSIRTIGSNEIKRNPGGNRDISKVIRSLPGVAAIPSFRNDIIIRGGAASENRFYLDGIEIPNINHFSTQGASGGPVGMLNVDLIKEVEFYSGAFPASRGNALSSVFEFEVKEARKDKYTANVVLGSSDLAIAAEGPTGKNSSLIMSVRRSYLQGLFSLLGLPFLPTYNDMQFKWKSQINDKNQLTILGLGAIDQFKLNLEVGEDSTNENFLSNKYLLANLPVNEQWNYVVGAKFDHFKENGKWSLIVSRNALQNDAFKHIDNDESLAKTFDYSSRETENKIRFENKIIYPKDWKLVYGVGYEYVDFFARNNSVRFLPSSDALVNFVYNTNLNLQKYGGFVQTSKKLLNDRIILSAGLRMDGTDFNSKMSNPLEHLSPRISARYSFAPGWSINANTGIYYQLPAYTALAFQSNGAFVNKNADYISNRQVVGGLEYNWDKRNTIITVEGFYKKYSNYPLSIANGISLANFGADFGVVGNEALLFTGEGRTYGVEVLYQQKFFKGLYGIMAYTFVRSEFRGVVGEYIPSSWDSRHLLSMTGGWKFGKNWEIGGRFQLSGGLPYTPDNVEASINVATWDAIGFGIPDYSQLNSQRIKTFHQLDIRVDKKWFFKKWSLDVFLDIQNIYNQQTQLKPILDVKRDSSGNPVLDTNNPGNYQYNFLPNTNGSVLPTVGVIIEI